MTANRGEYGLLLSHADGVTTRYAYDAAGRLVKEGSKTYRYGYLIQTLLYSAEFMKLSNSLANQAVYDWFDVHRDKWERITDLGDFRRWRVKE